MWLFRAALVTLPQLSDCSTNSLTKLPKIGGLQCLTSLDLSHNNLQSLPETIASLGALKSLRLIGNSAELSMALYKSEWFARLRQRSVLDQSEETVLFRAEERRQERRANIEEVHTRAAAAAAPAVAAATHAGQEVARLNFELDNYDFGLRRQHVAYGDHMELRMEATVKRAQQRPHDHRMNIDLKVEWHGPGSELAKANAEPLRRVYSGGTPAGWNGHETRYGVSDKEHFAKPESEEARAAREKRLAAKEAGEEARQLALVYAELECAEAIAAAEAEEKLEMALIEAKSEAERKALREAEELRAAEAKAAAEREKAAAAAEAKARRRYSVKAERSGAGQVVLVGS